MATPTDEGDYFDRDLDWQEQANGEALGSENFGYKDASIVIPFQTDWSKRAMAIRQILGYSWTDGSSLKRYLPMRHPEFPWMYATRITNGHGVGFVSEAGETVQIPSTKGNGFYVEWDLYKANVEFMTSSRGAMLEDGDVVAEYERFTTIDFETNQDIISLSAGVSPWKFAENLSGDTTPKGTQFQGEINQIVPKPDIQLTWHQVPRTFIAQGEGLSSGFGFYPTKFIEAIQAPVNSDIFLNYAAGTLLLRSIKFDRYVSQYQVPGFTDNEYYDITVSFSQYDPPQGAGLSAESAGWQTVPWRVVDSGTKLKFLLVTNDGETTGARIYPESDFADMFTYWNS